MQFKGPQINYYVKNIEKSKEFYEKLGFILNFTAIIDGEIVHQEFVLDGFSLGIATHKSVEKEHGFTPGTNLGCELVLWVEDTDAAIEFCLENGATLLSPPHNFLDNRLRAGWIRDLDGNPIQLVSKNSR